MSLRESDTQLGFLSDLVSQVGLVEPIVVHEVLIVSGSFNLGLIRSSCDLWSVEYPIWEENCEFPCVFEVAPAHDEHVVVVSFIRV